MPPLPGLTPDGRRVVLMRGELCPILPQTKA